ncbi:MAG: TRAP transporter small permease subunit [Dehalococcoidia bacterium]|nr:TRAP transporter small permease subunit [Dehalococcoidia bacterium]
MKAILRTIDSLSQWSGKSARWLALALVLVMANETIMRYVFNKPTVWGFETAVMMGASLYALGASYAHWTHSHIRIDVFYSRLSVRKRTIIDVLGTIFVCFPLMVVLVSASVSNAWAAWVGHETLKLTFWYPPSGPLRTVVAVGFVLLSLQVIAQFFRDVYLLIRNTPYD